MQGRKLPRRAHSVERRLTAVFNSVSIKISIAVIMSRGESSQAIVSFYMTQSSKMDFTYQNSEGQTEVGEACPHLQDTLS